MRTITYYLATNQVVESDAIYPNAFSADDNTTQLVFDFTGTACATWDKWLDLTMSDYTKDVQSLGTGTVVTFNLGAEHTKKGLLQVNPYAKNGTDKHGFPIYKLTIERQLNNSTVDASAQKSMIDYFDDRLTVKAVSATTLAPGESATASVTTEADGTTYVFGIPQGAQGIQGIQGVKGAQWRGAYSAGTTYVIDDVVSYNGSSYICILASTGNLPTDATYFSLVAQAGEVTTTQLNNAIATKADKLNATNLVTNGDFSNGTTGWNTSNATGFTVVGGVAEFTANAQNGRIDQATVQVLAGQKYYARALVKSTSSSVSFRTTDAQVGGLTLTHSGNNAFQVLSGIYTQTVNATIYARVVDARASAWDKIYADNILFINLTTTFGAGKEPTLTEIETMLSTFTNSWFNGTAELVSIANLAQLKADKTHGAWITPTLSNGWSHDYLGLFGICQYRVNSIGQIEFRGALSGGANGTNPFVLPVGSRPGKALVQTICGASGHNFSRISISSGTFQVIQYTTVVLLDGLVIPTT